MTSGLSSNTQAILLLTAPLIAGRGAKSTGLLTPGEYKRLARHLVEIQRQPADFLSADAIKVVHACRTVIDETRLRDLLDRGFLLSQAVEQWRSRAIWVVSRADEGYPRRLKTRLREDAPAVVYGCGDMTLLETGGFAVVGSRHVDDTLINYTQDIGELAAQASRTLVSGGARGIDQAAMRGALDARGTVIGILADSLEKMIMNRAHRNLLLDGQLVLISPYDPKAGFNVGNAMQRNKLIYALADACLVVNADRNKGGTWAGAVEQLNKLKYVPVYVRSTGQDSSGLTALRDMGALPWPNPRTTDEFQQVLQAPHANANAGSQCELSFSPDSEPANCTEKPGATSATVSAAETSPADVSADAPAQYAGNENIGSSTSSSPSSVNEPSAAESNVTGAGVATPEEDLFASVRIVLQRLLSVRMKESEVAVALNVSNVQARAWLKRLADEGLIERQGKPVRYIVKQRRLFE